MTDLNADIRQRPVKPPPALSRGGRRPRADRAAATAAAEKRWPLSRIISVALLILLLFSVAAMVAGGLALLGLHDHRERVVGTIDPARLQVQRLDTALVDQETGVRGYALSGQKDFLTPYNQGIIEEQNAIRALQAVIGQLSPSAAADLKSVTAQARFWRTHYAQPTI
ncbi:MAG TPA: CHASE3 domain-containing protein, partial [Streptosporangiaceae bacterium]|nr:CHASE3 domain-containing protein [Streptosporangiaceae bacterium]